MESNSLLAGWSGFEPESTPLQSNTITVKELAKAYYREVGEAGKVAKKA